MKRDDFLVEILTEELPPKSLRKLAAHFQEGVRERLDKAHLAFKEIVSFATPRRLGLLISGLDESQADQTVERKGPALQAAFDQHGKPTQACMGFARTCGVSPEALLTIKNAQGEWVGYTQLVTGKTVFQLMPGLIDEALQALPIAKRMRWGAEEMLFVRPVKGLLMLYGDREVQAKLFGCEAGRVSRGHRFHAPGVITIPHASTYPSLMEVEGKVMVDFNQRRERIVTLTEKVLHDQLGGKAFALIQEALLDEVVGLVEWPMAILGKFDEAFLRLPKEVLIASMQDHQRYFPVVDADQRLLPYFVTIINIHTLAPDRVILGNERVLRARLSDAAFFFEADQKERLEKRLDRLNDRVFQAGLGTLREKAERLALLSAFIAEKIGANAEQAGRAGLLAKADLTTGMVSEFPELQGVMGYYYALQDGEQKEVALAMKEHYLPRFSGDQLPLNGVSAAVALADRLDALVGTFGMNQIPTGDKDPYGLRRAALGVLRILIENKLNLDLKTVLEFAVNAYNVKLKNATVSQDVFAFLQERLRAWYQEQGIAADVFAAVFALQISNPLDMHARILAVAAFRKMDEAAMLSAANKRVVNILSKYNGELASKKIDSTLFENEAERDLSNQLDSKAERVMQLSRSGEYTQVLLELAALRAPIDLFFEQTMVMTEDVGRRENRMLLLGKLRALFLQVADIALLQ